jgi:hypothetical protein
MTNIGLTKYTSQNIDNMGFDDSLKVPMVEIIGADGNLVNLGNFNIPQHDYISVVRNATSNVWTYKTGGSGGTVVGTITVNYSDSTKAYITSIAKT